MSGKDKVNILLVDDQPGKLLSYEAVLSELDETLLKAHSAQEAFEHLLKTEVAVVLVDVCMPDLDGFELAKMIREHPRFQRTAIIFISAVLFTELDFLRGYESGAVDYVPVPVVPEILRAKVRIFSELYRTTRQLENLNRELERRVLERTAELQASTVELRRSEERLRLALDAAQMGWWDYDYAGNRITWSPNLVRIMGFEPSSFSSTPEGLVAHVHPEDRDKFLALLDGRGPDAGSRSCELRFICPDGSVRWSLTSGHMIRDAQGNPMQFAGVDLDITARKQTEERQTLLVRELDHRAKNLLAVVQSVLHLSQAATVEELVAAVDGRVRALSQAHSLLSEARWQGVDLARLVQQEIAPFSTRQAQQIVAAGPQILLEPATAQSMALALHELVTNAVKHGALSVPQGRVQLSWQLLKDELRVQWKETGGPPVTKPSRKGFGTKVIAASVERQLNGHYASEWLPEGLSCTLAIPRGRLGHAPSRSGVNAPAMPLPLPLQLGGRRVLVVEDEALIGLMMKDTLCEAGFEVSGPISTIAEALRAAEATEFDGAILDVNLDGESIYSVAEVLLAREVPFVFVTGYGADGIDPRFAQVPTVGKPLEPELLRRVFAVSASAAPLRAVEKQELAVASGG
jgi:PAS domain S-box-containing protein